MNPTFHPQHPASWWAQFEDCSEKFDRGSMTELLGDEIIARIPSLLLRREAETATAIVLRHLHRPSSTDLAEMAADATARLVATVERLDERATGDDAGTAEASALCRLLQGDWAEAAAQAEARMGTLPLVQAVVTALRLESFGADLVVRLLTAGQPPAAAVRTGRAIARYSWWPNWLLTIVSERVMAGTLTSDTIAALQRCAFAGLSPTQARMAKRLIAAEPQLIEATAHRLETLGEHPAATKLRAGCLDTVAFAARLIPV
ncbi:hypothetical protein [Paractinoplanes rishiriensis]|uniref:Uncharacterized protein n=1 Tax=Paractinoplanes rishiriensis TaxID=1050105 RepID=A0A919K2H2_9ACTN|nr:hypothetical protein [Actinoplanes rishiriensis]GIE97662.1 hypothetical protein Ari01nite_51270 [Actinoplanes rishiriensis]